MDRSTVISQQIEIFSFFFFFFWVIVLDTNSFFFSLEILAFFICFPNIFSCRPQTRWNKCGNNKQTLHMHLRKTCCCAELIQNVSASVFVFICALYPVAHFAHCTFTQHTIEHEQFFRFRSNCWNSLVSKRIRIFSLVDFSFSRFHITLDERRKNKTNIYRECIRVYVLLNRPLNEQQ